MLYKTLVKLVSKNGLTDELHEKIDTLYALGRISDEEYRSLVG